MLQFLGLFLFCFCFCFHFRFVSSFSYISIYSIYVYIYLNTHTCALHVCRLYISILNVCFSIQYLLFVSKKHLKQLIDRSQDLDPISYRHLNTLFESCVVSVCVCVRTLNLNIASSLLQTLILFICCILFCYTNRFSKVSPNLNQFQFQFHFNSAKRTFLALSPSLAWHWQAWPRFD